jgi:hypothetical protein
MPRRQLLDQQGIDVTCTVKSPLLIEIVEPSVLSRPSGFGSIQKKSILEANIPQLETE